MATKSNKNYDECDHRWKFHIDAARSGFPEAKPWASFYICDKCHNVINFLEKNSLDQIAAQNKSLNTQQTHTRNGMWANIISAVLMVTAVVTLLINQFCTG
jgi:hypothetical protein